MFRETCLSIAATGKSKLALLDAKPAAYLLSSVLGGAYIAFGSTVFIAAGGFLTAAGFAGVKFIACLLFSAALSLIIFAGADLFTGNNLTAGMSLLCKDIRPLQLAKLWAVCWLGNFIGSWIIVLLLQAGGVMGTAFTDYLTTVAAGKLAAGAPALVAKGMLCNICVCLAVWCGARMKSESGKLIMIAWCILIFMISGFEHSVANMSILGMALVQNAADATAASYAFNLFWVTVGNIIGGFACVALPYWYISGCPHSENN